MSFGKSSSKTSQQQQQAQTQAQTQTQTETPNNLPSLQQGWSLASNLFGGSNPAVNSAVNAITGAASAGVNSATAGMGTAGDLSTGGGTSANLMPFADGSMTGSNNPYLQSVLNQFAQQTQQATDGGMAASGRYGSGANANAFNSAVANASGQLNYQNYNDSLDRQVTAANDVNNAALQALGLIPGLSAAGTSAAQAGFSGAAAPATTYADILSLLGAGGGTTTAAANGNSSGTASGTGTSSTTSTGLNLGSLIQPFSLFGKGS